jgi:hypothetical protein
MSKEHVRTAILLWVFGCLGLYFAVPTVYSQWPQGAILTACVLLFILVAPTCVKWAHRTDPALGILAAGAIALAPFALWIVLH